MLDPELIRKADRVWESYCKHADSFAAPPHSWEARRAIRRSVKQEGYVEAGAGAYRVAYLVEHNGLKYVVKVGEPDHNRRDALAAADPAKRMLPLVGHHPKYAWVMFPHASVVQRLRDEFLPRDVGLDHDRWSDALASLPTYYDQHDGNICVWDPGTGPELFYLERA